MELRKLIGFGKATYSITLPKKWVKENALVKGDLILVQEKSPEKLEISPKLTEQQELIKEITLSVNGKSLKEIERELISAYINEYSIIHFVGNLQGRVGEIRNLLNELIGLEVMEVSNTQVMAKVFSDVTNTHVSNIIRRISMITKTMFEDLGSLLKGGEVQTHLLDSDKEVNRQTFFATRILTKAIKSAYFRGSVKMELTEAVFALAFINAQEKIADQLKNMARQLSETCILKKTRPEHIQEFITFLNRIVEPYETAVRSYMGRDRKLANDAMGETEKIRADLLECVKAHCVMPVPYMTSSLGTLACLIADLSLAVYNIEF